MSTQQSKPTRAPQDAPPKNKPLRFEDMSPDYQDMVEQAVQRYEKQSVTFSVEGQSITLTMAIIRACFANKTKKGFKPTDKELWLFMKLCEHRRLDPFTGDAFLVGYDSEDGPKFNLIVSHQAVMKRAERTGKKVGFRSGVVVKHKSTGEMEDVRGDIWDPEKTDLVGAWCEVHRSDYKLPVYDRIDLRNYRGFTPVWKNNASMMLVKCAEVAAHRLAFPLEIGGLYTADELDKPQDKTSAPEPKQSAINKIKNQVIQAPEPESDERETNDFPPDIAAQVAAGVQQLKVDSFEAIRAAISADEVSGIVAQTRQEIETLGRNAGLDVTKVLEEVYDFGDQQLEILSKN